MKSDLALVMDSFLVIDEEEAEAFLKFHPEALSAEALILLQQRFAEALARKDDDLLQRINEKTTLLSFYQFYGLTLGAFMMRYSVDSGDLELSEVDGETAFRNNIRSYAVGLSV